MLVFAWPMMLAGAGAVALVGVAALWRGMRGKVRVSSTRLWQGLNEEASGGRRRTIDPVWFMILLGAVLLALAISGPAWRSGDRPDAAQVEWSVRSIADGDPELFVRVHCKDGIAQIDDVPNSQFQIQHGVGEKIVPVHASDGKLHL